MEWIVSLMLCLIIFLVYQLLKIKKTTEASKQLKQIQEDIETAKELCQSIKQEYETMLKRREYLTKSIQEGETQNKVLEVKIHDTKRLIAEQDKLLNEKINNATDLVAKEIELQKAKLQTQLDEDLKKIKENSPLAAYQKELEDARKQIEVLHQQQKQQLEQENFDETHSISISGNDREDIAVIRDCASHLHRKEILNKAIWQEFFQKSLQTLRKELDADKTTGIYKITEKESGLAYVGQAIDIGDRWTQHVKEGLGVGSLSYLTNKFYKRLYRQGIENFTFEILEICKKSELDAKEAYWINFYNTVDFGFNSKLGNK